MNKVRLYFLLAGYFQFWAKIVLKRWKPLVITIIGSAGKTTTLSLLKAILQTKASVKVAHKANAVTSIPLDILGLKQQSFSLIEWLKLIFLAPFKIWQVPRETVYLCEMDSDRWGEMQAHTRLIEPDITCWVSAHPCHTENFPGEDISTVIKQMLFDVGFAVERTRCFSLVNGEAKEIESELKRVKAPISFVSLNANPEAAVNLVKHNINLSGTETVFSLNYNQLAKLKKKLPTTTPGLTQNYPEKITLSFPLAILTKANMYGLGMALVLGYLFNIPYETIQNTLKTWRLPPGRMSLFAGKKATTIIDSSYNSSRVAASDALTALRQLGGSKTIAVLGDMRELGKVTQKEHEAVANAIIENNIRRVILIGPQMEAFVWPILMQNGYKENRTLFKTLDPQWAADLLTSEDFLRHGETILVKGSQNTLFLEGIVEQLLVSKKDVAYLCRREKLWNKARQKIYSKLT
ncbi:MAG: glutamate ligase domain-containing protein [Patescibacteria group bacterium]|jgi:UDP-N-acetylmuramyl pentapeptide synthase